MKHKQLAAKLPVSVIASTNRPQFFDRLLANFMRQRHAAKELIIVLNKDSMQLAHYRKKASDKKLPVSVYQLPEKTSLGYCLNYAVSKSRYEHIARFDDDDYYSPSYLDKQLEAMYRTKADIIGKRACLIYLESSGQLILRYPTEQNRFTTEVAGATLLSKKRVFEKIRFRNISLGESVGFLQRSKKAGYRIYATDCGNYVIIRRTDKKGHTWKISDKQLISQSKVVNLKGADYRKYAEKKQGLPNSIFKSLT
ncbi:glycosyltransferase family 2 protein [Paenibacillus sp. NEAU-GSW1]|uniref:glycosyltransferase n=1 Tax=Paenibacillus sp. NEAU-GSW1 TaxID=2682486 RepID=UPI0012E26F99|nr:glycosyltransferase family A protein [Paenibacillus sp. NEAU-GSW1]MUT67087.1 glycosyltransferase [Paenibacillus sp. NEAU-GSW1]